MAIIPEMVGLVVKNVTQSLKFYRTLGLAIPEGQDQEPYVDFITPNGYRLS